MATRKQRRRTQKGRRHEYETVWIDDVTGEELEEPPDDQTELRAKPTPRKPGEKRMSRGPSNQSMTRSVRTPLPPSWRRAAKRSLLLGGVIFVLFALLNSKNGNSGYASALILAAGYTALFIPFTYYVDRFTYRRWERKMAEQPKKR